MWIKEPPKEFSASKNDESSNDKLNFLFKSDNIFIMDNHLAAGWVWPQFLDVKKSYNLFHIDQHYDLLDYPNLMKSEIIDKGLLLNELSLNDYLILKQPPESDNFKMFRWDNYISYVNDAFPKFFNLRYFATDEKDYELEGFITKKISSENLIETIKTIIGNSEGDKWILNLDIDYFFDSGSPITQKLDDTFIIKLVTEIKLQVKNIEIITICLSPECCGGWTEAIKKLKLICSILNVNFAI
jgi:hypothetical protein